jgi:hypothetical protein
MKINLSSLKPKETSKSILDVPSHVVRRGLEKEILACNTIITQNEGTPETHHLAEFILRMTKETSPTSA